MISKIMTGIVALGLATAAHAVELTGPAKVDTKPVSNPLPSVDVTATTATMVCSQGPGDKLLCKPIESGDVEFTTKNLIVLRGPISAQSASKFVQDFHELEHRDEVTRIYVYLQSPGGSIFAGDDISNIIHASKKEVVVVIDFAASMAFHIAEQATKRLIVPTGTMMQHHASGGPSPGQFPNVDKQWDWIKRKVSMMNKEDAAACSKTTFEDFMKNIDRDWWLLSQEAVAAGCVDGIATKVTCSKDLMNKTVVESVSFFGMVIDLVWSGCPLETYPRDVKIKGSASFDRPTDKQRAMAEEYVQLISDPLQYYSVHGSFNLDRLLDKDTPPVK